MKLKSQLIKFSQMATVIAAGVFSAGCFYSGGDYLESSTAQFVDSPVIGISYRTSSGIEGTTDGDGMFQFQEGESVTFYIGKAELPAGIPQGDIITPAHLAGTADWEDDTTALNIIQFLLSIDEDQNPDNGIQIPEGLAELFDEEIEEGINWSEEEFDSNFEEFLVEVASVELDIDFELVDEETARSHFSATIDALGITIEITVNTETQGCNSSNISDIEGSWSATLAGQISESVDVDVESNGDISVDGEDFDAKVCVYSQSEVTVLDQTIIVGTWVWTDGSDIVNITDTGTTFTITVTEGSSVGTGSLSVNK